jgi:hypothetical protein
MKKLLIALFFMIPSISHAQLNEQLVYFCQDLSTRYTIFHTIAGEAKDENEYRNYLYTIMLKLDTTKETRDLLITLIDVAWRLRDEQVIGTSRLVFRACMKDEEMI